jgi:GMP synthase-like glutamine amidotransferase
VAEDEVLVLQHQEDAGPGNLTDYLDQHRFPHRVVRVGDEGLPRPGHHRALVVLGSRESSYDGTVPWAAPERDFTAACAVAGTPVLGICFGAQQLCTVLGGRVRPLPRPEIGWTAVTGPEPFGGTWFSWHGDVMELPPVELLATTPVAPHAFRYGPHLGLQFHPELTADTLRDWSTQLRRAGLVETAGRDPRTVLDPSPERIENATEAAFRLYDEFFRPAGGGRV